MCRYVQHSYNIGQQKNIFDSFFRDNLNYLILFRNLSNQSHKSLLIGNYPINIKLSLYCNGIIILLQAEFLAMIRNNWLRMRKRYLNRLLKWSRITVRIFQFHWIQNKKHMVYSEFKAMFLVKKIIWYSKMSQDNPYIKGEPKKLWKNRVFWFVSPFSCNLTDKFAYSISMGVLSFNNSKL